MIAMRPEIYIIDDLHPRKILKKLELSARICWQSEPNNIPSATFIKNIITRGHESVLEHVSITVDMIVDRGVSHELVRHRIASYSQESTRYVKYDKGGMLFIDPIEMTKGTYAYDVWNNACRYSERAYKNMRALNVAPETARNVLNNSVKTHIRVTMNIRSYRKMLRLRCARPAHPHMKQVMIPLLLHLKKTIPVLFDDIGYDRDFFEKYLQSDWGTYIKDYKKIP